MHALSSFDYAVIRVVPRVDRQEFLNAGVILFCLEQRFLRACVYIDDKRVRALWPELDLDLLFAHLQAMVRIADGDPAAGPIAQLSQRERFHWLVAPRSTVIQVSPAHSGLCEAPEAELEHLMNRLVR